jgi:guanosine-3',5'-bis(diphosphate) 3'-pyrophosphohydrolase
MEAREILEQVIAFTDRAHAEQMRKYTPDRYIVHPVRVMELLKEYTSDISVLAAAIMHDVLEDTPVKEEEIRRFLRTFMDERTAERTVSLVVELTDVYIKADYPQLNRRKRKDMEVERMARTSPDAQTIKYADIIDNCREIVTHDPSFARVFLRECSNLLRKMRGGNQELHKKAQELVAANLKRL